MALCCELNFKWKPPKFKGYSAFNKKSDKRFHGLALYVSSHLSGSVLRIPDEDEELEVIHVLVKSTVPNLNIIGCYLDVESRQDNITVERIWTKLVSKVEVAVGRGEGVVLMGDMNRPLQTQKPSFGTKLLMEWEKKGLVHILNDKGIPTRIDPHTGKGSVLDLGIVTQNLKNMVTNFVVDSDRKWSPFALKPVPGGSHEKKFSDHLAIKIQIGITKKAVK